MQMDKKAGREGIRLVLLEGIGRAVVTAAPEQAVLRAAIERQLH
jgi:3-dehydroquinate synthetase